MYSLVPIFYLILLATADNQWATFPKVPKTASINGFADPIIDLLPDCAKDCVKISTKNTPCPYWDTGCFCVMPQWAGLMGQCFANNCKGEDVASARFLATSLCNQVGANTVMMPASISEALARAIGTAKEVTTIEGKTVSWVVETGQASETADGTGNSSPAETTTDANTTSENTSASTSDTTVSSETKTNLGYKTSNLASLFLLLINLLALTPAIWNLASALNGFAEAIYDDLPICAQPCVDQDTGNTPCPDWEMGCLCGTEVVSATSLAMSACSSYGVADPPYWRFPEAANEALVSAANVAETSAEVTDEPVETDEPMNGFAEAIYDDLPICAQPCVDQDTGNTPCPSWEMGCLCVMPQFGGPIAFCIAENCKGTEVVSATSLAMSACSSYGVSDPPYWRFPEAANEALISAANVAETSAEVTDEPVETDEPMNGFAEAIYDDLPKCAQPCVDQDTGNTPCPSWEMGCLCVMPQFGGPIAFCIAENCKGTEVVSATSLAMSACSSYGVSDPPYWRFPEAANEALISAANVAETSAEVTDEPAETTDEPAETTDVPVETTETPTTSVNPIHSAIINGFADPIYDLLPSCAQPCVNQTTGNTPCPKGDTGCLCMMPQFGGPVAYCIADNCPGSDVVSATSLAISMCSSVGVREPYWYAPDEAYEALSSAANVAETSAEVTDGPVETTQEPAETTEDVETSEDAESSEDVETGEDTETTKAEESKTDAETETKTVTTDCDETSIAGDSKTVAKTETKTVTDCDETCKAGDSKTSSAAKNDDAPESNETQKTQPAVVSTRTLSESETSAATVSAFENGVNNKLPSMLGGLGFLINLVAFAPVILLVSAEDENPYSTFPSVARTASINGFADRIYDQLPACAQPCVREGTDKTPCPYWDTGCLCVMPQFAGPIANCIADNCKGAEVLSADSLATSLCSAAGVWEPYWMVPEAGKEALSSAANVAETPAETTTDTPAPTSEPAKTTEPEQTTEAEKPTEAEKSTEAEKTTEAANTTEPANTTAAAEESAEQPSVETEEASSVSDTPAPTVSAFENGANQLPGALAAFGNIMRFSSIVATAALLTQAIAANVRCLVNGVQVAIVDLDTGVCPFTIPDTLPILFDFVSPEDFDIIFYYSLAAGERFFNDIVNAGDVISIPANLLFNNPGAPLYQVQVQQEPATNSTEAVRKRLWKDTVVVKRDAASDFADTLKGLDGTLVYSGAFSVELVEESSTTGPETGATTTSIATVVTVVTCTETVCVPTTVPAKPTITTATINEVVTVFTTYCPESSITVPTFTITITKEGTVTTCPATPALTTITSAGVATVVVTTCPITETATVTKPTAAPPAPPAPATTPGQATTAAPGQATTVAPAPGPSPATTTAAAVPTFEAAAGTLGAPFLALALIPLAYFI
ncbi:putative GPI-anchored protein 7 [Spathaspora sp. JA1]|nr:putative GPI-anchored protein 7 [Spathaspora sp. JA1]